MTLRLAYADPPYIGLSHYYNHPDAARWDDPGEHHELMAMMAAHFDGWALSCSSPTLGVLLAGAPAGVRVAAWVKPFCAYKRNVRIAYSWEPVLFVPGRDRSSEGAPIGRDHLAAPMAMRRGLIGAKPPRFNRWVLDLLGYVDGDDVTDLFPGTGGMGQELAQGRLW